MSKRTIDALVTGDRPQFYFDTDLKGFGLKVMPTGSKTFWPIKARLSLT
ncbi:MAG: DUF4102 domain-containing protein [Sphingobacteriales bacterium]|nr:MAG: DUF4102 domain-containing protein [Sphingobacteriales bacterium]